MEFELFYLKYVKQVEIIAKKRSRNLDEFDEFKSECCLILNKLYKRLVEENVDFESINNSYIKTHLDWGLKNIIDKKIINNSSLTTKEYAELKKTFNSCTKDGFDTYNKLVSKQNISVSYDEEILSDELYCFSKDSVENLLILKDTLKKIKKEERYILYLYFKVGLTQNDIAKIFKTSKQAIGQRIKNIINKLKMEMI